MNDTDTSLRDLADDLDRISADILAVREEHDPIAALAVIAGELRKQATAAPPRPDVTRNVDWIIRAVMPGHPAEPGLYQSWYVAAERDDGCGDWVTWEAYLPETGRLAYTAGHYEVVHSPAENKRLALADLAVRAGLLRGVALRVADEVASSHRPDLQLPADREDRRMAARLRKWATAQ